MLALNASKSQLNEYVSNILFVTNLPPYLEEQMVKSVFNCFGKVDHVLFDAKPTAKNFDAYLIEQENSKNKIKSYFNDDIGSQKSFGYRDAYVLFNQSQAIERAMIKPKNDRIVTVGSVVNTGVKSM